MRRASPRGGDDPKRRHMTPTSIMWRRLATQSRSMAAQSRPQAAQQPTIEKLIPKSPESALTRTVKPSKSYVFQTFLNVFHRYRFSIKSPETSKKRFPKAPKREPGAHKQTPWARKKRPWSEKANHKPQKGSPTSSREPQSHPTAPKAEPMTPKRPPQNSSGHPF